MKAIFILLVAATGISSVHADDSLLAKCSEQALNIGMKLNEALIVYPVKYSVKTLSIGKAWDGRPEYTFEVSKTSPVNAEGTITFTEGWKITLGQRYGGNFCDKLVSLNEIFQ